MIMYIWPLSGENLLLIWFSWLVRRILSSTSDPTDDLTLIQVDPNWSLVRLMKILTFNCRPKIQRRDGNDKVNKKENNRINEQNNNFAYASDFFAHFFVVFALLRRENA